MSSPYTDVKHVLANFFDQFVDPWGSSNQSPFTQNQGVLFTVQLNHEYYHEKHGNGCIHAHCHIIITAKKNVFFACEEDENGWPVIDWRKIPVDKWYNTSNHDSCWRTDGFRKLYEKDQECFEKAHAYVPNGYKFSYSDAHQFNRIGTGITAHKFVNFVEIEHEALDSGNSYHRKITSIKELKAKLVLVEG